jgi:hypothetical protein
VTTTPHWHATDEQTASLLDLLADDGSVSPSKEQEWSVFLLALVTAKTRDGGVIRANRMRPMVRDKVAPQRIGPFYRRACLEGLIVADGWEVSDDAEGKNSGKPARTYRWLGAR